MHSQATRAPIIEPDIDHRPLNDRALRTDVRVGHLNPKPAGLSSHCAVESEGFKARRATSLSEQRPKVISSDKRAIDERRPIRRPSRASIKTIAGLSV